MKSFDYYEIHIFLFAIIEETSICELRSSTHVSCIPNNAVSFSFFKSHLNFIDRFLQTYYKPIQMALSSWAFLNWWLPKCCRASMFTCLYLFPFSFSLLIVFSLLQISAEECAFTSILLYTFEFLQYSRRINVELCIILYDAICTFPW